MSEAKSPAAGGGTPDTWEPVELVLEVHKEQIARVRAALNGKAPDTREANLKIYKFLKGWKYNEQKVLSIMTEMYEWREKYGMDEVSKRAPLLTQKEFPHYDKVIRVYPHAMSHKVDRSGQPISIERLGRANPEVLVRIMTQDQLNEYQRYYAEHKEAIADKLTLETGKVMRQCKIFDLDGLGTRHLNRAGLAALREVLRFTQDYYPEALGNLYIVNAPWIFKTIWAIVKPWLNEATLSKVQILGANYKEVLHQRIDPANLPDFLGGTCKCPGGCVAEVPIDEGYTVVDIKSRGSHEAKVEIKEAGATAAWEFRTRAKDVSFAAHFIPAGGSEKQVVSAMKRYSSDQATVSGAHEAKAPGVLYLTFDNSHSMFTSKTVLYRVDITKPAEEAAAAAATLPQTPPSALPSPSPSPSAESVSTSESAGPTSPSPSAGPAADSASEAESAAEDAADAGPAFHD